MYQRTLSILAFFACFYVGWSQQSTDSIDRFFRAPNNSLMMHVGGAGYGIGPGYEWMGYPARNVGLGFSFALPLIHPNFGSHYTPFSISPGVNLIVGARYWKTELSAEYNVYMETGRNPYGGTYNFQTQTMALMAGLRRQDPNGGILFRANIGAAIFDVGQLPQLLPAVTLSMGYTFRPKTKEELPPKPILQLGTHAKVADSVHRKTIAFRFAPFAGVELHRQWQREKDNDWVGLASSRRYDFQFQTRWATHLGVMADIGKPKGIVGLRLSLSAGLRAVRYDWQIHASSLLTQYPYYATFQTRTHIDDLQAEVDLNVGLRIRTRAQNPWVFVVGGYAGGADYIRRRSWVHFPTPPMEILVPPYTGIGIGPMVSISKQIKLGNSILEPYWSGRLSASDVSTDAVLHNMGTTIGVIVWLGGKQ